MNIRSVFILLLALLHMASVKTRAQDPSRGYTLGDGLSVSSQDGKYSMTMKGRMVSFLEADPDGTTSMGIQKARLNLSGHLLSPTLTYSLQLGFAPQDNAQLPNGNANFVRDAILFYRPDAHWTLGIGQAKVKANRAHMNSSQNLVFTQRSIVDGKFELDRDFGVFVEYSGKLAPGFPVVLKASVTSGEGRNFLKSGKSGLAYTGRIELYPLGKFEGSGALVEGDMDHEDRPRLMIAGAYSLNDDAMRLGGQTGDLIQGKSRSLSTYYADLVLKYAGFTLAADLMGRTCEDPIITGGGQFIYKGSGYNFQVSCNIRKDWEVALRNSTLKPDREIRHLAGYKTCNQTTLALTRYIIGHGFKVQADASYTRRQESLTDYARWLLRMGMEIAF